MVCDSVLASEEKVIKGFRFAVFGTLALLRVTKCMLACMIGVTPL
jgi:hypothetical protein